MATYLKRRGPDGRSVWQVKVRKRGWPQQSGTFDLKAHAIAWAQKVEREMESGVAASTSEAENTTLGEALARYGREVTPSKKSAADEKYKLSVWAHSPLMNRVLSRIHGKDVAHWRDNELARGSAPGTVRRLLALLSHVFEVARKEWGMETLRNPCAAIRSPAPGRGRDRRLLPGEEPRLLTACAAYGGAIGSLVLLALETAMRRGEIAAMRWEHLDRTARVLRVPETKTGVPRRVPLSSRALAVLDALPRRIDGYVWGIRADSITQAFSRAVAAGRRDYEAECKAAREKPDPRMLVGLRFHDLRHEATSRLFEKGLNPMEVSTITGHKTLTMLKRYTHLRAEDLVDRLG